MESANPAKTSTQTADEETSRNVTVTLVNKSLWDQFNEIGTEMIITKSGRRMFPSLDIAIQGLSDHFQYVVTLDIASIDQQKYKFNDSLQEWTVISRRNDPLPCVGWYRHPASPLTSKKLSQGISFNKLKLTNQPRRFLEGTILLDSMRKYVPRVYVITEKDYDARDWSRALVFAFKETEFIAVTAYMNKMITKLKIETNPFARGFREFGKYSSKMKLRDADITTVTFEQGPPSVFALPLVITEENLPGKMIHRTAEQHEDAPFVYSVRANKGACNDGGEIQIVHINPSSIVVTDHIPSSIQPNDGSSFTNTSQMCSPSSDSSLKCYHPGRHSIRAASLGSDIDVTDCMFPTIVSVKSLVTRSNASNPTIGRLVSANQSSGLDDFEFPDSRDCKNPGKNIERTISISGNMNCGGQNTKVTSFEVCTQNGVQKTSQVKELLPDNQRHHNSLGSKGNHHVESAHAQATELIDLTAQRYSVSSAHDEVDSCAEQVFSAYVKEQTELECREDLRSLDQEGSQVSVAFEHELMKWQNHKEMRNENKEKGEFVAQKNQCVILNSENLLNSSSSRDEASKSCTVEEFASFEDDVFSCGEGNIQNNDEQEDDPKKRNSSERSGRETHEKSMGSDDHNSSLNVSAGSSTIEDSDSKEEADEEEEEGGFVGDHEETFSESEELDNEESDPKVPSSQTSPHVDKLLGFVKSMMFPEVKLHDVLGIPQTCLRRINEAGNLLKDGSRFSSKVTSKAILSDSAQTGEMSESDHESGDHVSQLPNMDEHGPGDHVTHLPNMDDIHEIAYRMNRAKSELQKELTDGNSVLEINKQDAIHVTFLPRKTQGDASTESVSSDSANLGEGTASLFRNRGIAHYKETLTDICKSPYQNNDTASARKADKNSCPRADDTDEPTCRGSQAIYGKQGSVTEKRITEQRENPPMGKTIETNISSCLNKTNGPTTKESEKIVNDSSEIHNEIVQIEPTEKSTIDKPSAGGNHEDIFVESVSRLEKGKVFELVAGNPAPLNECARSQKPTRIWRHPRVTKEEPPDEGEKGGGGWGERKLRNGLWLLKRKAGRGTVPPTLLQKFSGNSYAHGHGSIENLVLEGNAALWQQMGYSASTRKAPEVANNENILPVAQYLQNESLAVDEPTKAKEGMIDNDCPFIVNTFSLKSKDPMVVSAPVVCALGHQNLKRSHVGQESVIPNKVMVREESNTSVTPARFAELSSRRSSSVNDARQCPVRIDANNHGNASNNTAALAMTPLLPENRYYEQVKSYKFNVTSLEMLYNFHSPASERRRPHPMTHEIYRPTHTTYSYYTQGNFCSTLPISASKQFN